jgi:hypothetical protein
MALVGVSAISGARATLLDDDVVSQINRAVVLSQILDVGTGTGKNISWDVSTGTALPGTAVIADGADVTNFNNDDKAPATLDFGTYHDAFGITGKAMAMAKNTGNPQQLANLFAEYMAESMERLAFGVADGVYNGDGSTNTIHGLHDASIPAIGDVGIYAGVNRASISQWQGNVLDAVGGEISTRLLNQLGRDIYTASGRRPDLYITDPIQHEKIAATLQMERRFVDEVRTAKGVIKLDGGYNVLYHGGAAILEDIQHPAAKISALNTMYAKLHQLPDAADEINGSIGMVTLGGTPEDQMESGKTKLVARIQPLAKLGDSHKFALYCYPQQQIKKPQCFGYLDNLG